MLGMIAQAVVYLIVIAFGISVGTGLGDFVGARICTRRDYVLYHLAGLLLTALVVALAQLMHILALQFLALGLFVGFVGGIKMGFAESVGIWKFVDRFLGINAAHLKAARDSQSAETQRHARRSQEAQKREYISVSDDTSSQTARR